MIFRYIAKEILGEYIFSKFIELKRKEIEEYKKIGSMEEKAVILYEILLQSSIKEIDKLKKGKEIFNITLLPLSIFPQAYIFHEG